MLVRIFAMKDRYLKSISGSCLIPAFLQGVFLYKVQLFKFIIFMYSCIHILRCFWVASLTLVMTRLRTH